MKWVIGAAILFLLTIVPLLHGLAVDPTLMRGHPPTISYLAGIYMLSGPIFGPIGILCVVRAWHPAAAVGGTGIIRSALVFFSAAFLCALLWSCYEWMRHFT